MLRNNGKLASSLLMVLDVSMSGAICLALLFSHSISGLGDRSSSRGRVSCSCWPVRPG
ncbi:MAG: hypothetical protein R3E53_07675 [Myxococcota bacterium]